MFFAKIVVKNNYKEKGDLVYRPLLRVYAKLKTAYNVMDDDVPLLGFVVDNDFFELTTWRKIPDAEYVIISKEEFETIISNLKIENLRLLRELIEFSIFNESSKIDYGISTIEDLILDRKIDYDAFNNFLTDINPYEESISEYNNFVHRCMILKNMKEDNAYGRKM